MDATLFNRDNTDGFTESDLALLNAAAAVLIARGWDEKSAADRVTNRWQPSGNTIHSLTL